MNVVVFTQRFNAGLQSAARQVGVFTASVGKSLRVLTPFSSMFGAGLVFGGAFALIGAGKAANEFAGEMNRSLAIMQNVGPQMRAEMERTAQSVAASTQFTQRELARSFFFLASAGMDAEQSMKSLQQVAFFAQAGNFDLATAVDLVTDAQSAMGLKSQDATKNLANLTLVTDQLTRANTLGNASVQQFSETLTNKAGAAARMYGLSLAEVLGMAVAFADQGVKSAEAGTRIAIVLRDMATKSIKFKEAFDEAGLSVWRFGEMVPPAELFKNLEDIMEGLTGLAQKKILIDMQFSDKSVSATQSLIGFSHLMGEATEQIKNGGVTTKNVAKSSLTDFDKAWNRITGTMSKASTEAFTPILGQLASMMDGLVGTADATDKLADSTSKAASEWENLGKWIVKIVQQQEDLRKILNGPQKIAKEFIGTIGALAPDILGKGLGEGLRESVRSLKEFKREFINDLLGVPDPVKGISEEQHGKQRRPTALSQGVRPQSPEVLERKRIAAQTLANMDEAKALFNGMEKTLGRQSEEWADSMARARRMVIAVETPLEKYKSTLMDIKNLADKMPADFIPTAKRALARAEVEFRAETKQPELTPGPTPALLAGSVAAANAIARAMQTSFPVSSIDQTAKNTADILTQTRLSAQLLEQLNKKEDKPGTVDTVTPI